MTEATAPALDETHEPSQRSRVESANRPDTDFPIQNLPLGVFRHPSGSGAAHIGVAIGDRIFDLHLAARSGALNEIAPQVQLALLGDSLNPIMAQGRPAARSIRRAAFRLLRADGEKDLDAGMLVPAAECELLLPARVGDYTDFYASIDHATNVGSMFRPDAPLLPNYKWVPIGYHGRASSIVASGATIRRPSGQVRDGDTAPPEMRPTRALDYECEVAAWVGKENPLGEAVPIAGAEEHLFGLGLLNDWSARDVQRWEYQPLGPFLAKSFATTVSPWVVTLDALEPFRVPAASRSAGDPEPLAYLSDGANRGRGGFGVTLEVFLASAAMRRAGLPPLRLSRSSLASMYWTLAQLVAHHTSNGCNLRAGDLLGSGTISGPARDARGCLLELTWGGRDPLELPSGETRKFLEDGDEVTIRGHCEREGFASIGFGECRGVVS